MNGRVLSEPARAEIKRLMAQFPHRQSALLGVLFVAQAEAGLLSAEVMAEVAEVMQLPVTEVTSVASFYHLFHFARTGRVQIQVCTNVSCLLNGCGQVLHRVRQRLGIDVGQTTPDGRFTLQTAECLAACDIAPMMMVGPQLYGPLTADQVDAVLDRVLRDA